MKTINFTIFGQPFGKKNMQPVKRGSFCTSVNPTANKNYMAKVQDAYFQKYENENNYTMDSPITITIVAYFGLQKACYNSKGKIKLNGIQKLNGDILPTMKPDHDNISKAICDALTGIVWRDDSQITDSHISKRYAETPRVEVTIEINTQEN